jgi:hypothetical protein
MGKGTAKGVRGGHWTPGPGGHTGTRNSYFNTLDFLKENVEFSYRIYTVNAHILFCYTARSLNIFF